MAGTFFLPNKPQNEVGVDYVKSIFNKKLYDTNKLEKLCNVGFSGYSAWITSKGSLFLFNDITMQICNTDQERIKDILGQENPEKYIELFGEVDEA